MKWSSVDAEGIRKAVKKLLGFHLGIDCPLGLEKNSSQSENV